MREDRDSGMTPHTTMPHTEPVNYVTDRAFFPLFLIRIVHDLSKRLDDLLSRASHVCDLFTPEAVLYRVRLRDHCARLVAADPIRHGSAAVEAFWRKGVYETIVTSRSVKVGVRHSRDEVSLIITSTAFSGQ